jgi:hypothetical protein
MTRDDSRKSPPVARRCPETGKMLTRLCQHGLKSLNRLSQSNVELRPNTVSSFCTTSEMQFIGHRDEMSKASPFP